MADELNQSAATREDTEPKDNADLVKLWLDALELSGNEESKWRERAQSTVNIYRNERNNDNQTVNAGDRRFNILHSNIETIIPAIYNSTPVPDVRRRFNDDDQTGKEVADLIERALAFSVDSYDFDQVMQHAIKDEELTGRGVSRVRYMPYLGKGAVETSGKEPDETLDYEEVLCEHVPWKHFRRGPSRTWDDVPWEAFELFLTREELVRLNDKIGGKVDLDTTIAGADDKKNGDNLKEIFKRARVWEIWDKESRKVIFIAPSYKEEPLKIADDPLELMGFFCTPKPLYAIETSDNLIPVIPYDIYRDQAEELERVSRRIMALVEGIKSRGVYDGSMTELSQLAEADDNTLIAVENATRYADGKGIESGIAWWPMDSAIKALAQLVEHREAIKQTIYEITGISDILRGETQANETATAQNIKQQWGSLRIQNKQGEIQRYARDLFRLKAEIIANKFQWETITLMTGQDYPAQADKQKAQLAVQQYQQQAQMAQQAGQQVPPPPDQLQEILKKPSREEVEQLLRNDATRNFRVDVESDSTIRADMTRNQQNMTLFLQGTAQFAQAMGPIVMTYPEMTPAVLEVYAAFSRNFKLGKQAEDALDNVSDKAKQSQQSQQQKPPSPEQQKIQADIQAKQAEMQMQQQQNQAEMEMKAKELEFKKEEAQLKLQIEQAKLEFEGQRHQHEMALKQQEIAAKMQLEQQKAENDARLKEIELQHNAQLKEQETQQQMQIAQSKAEQDAEIKRTSMVDDIKRKGLEAAQKAQQSDTQFKDDRQHTQLAFDLDQKRAGELHEKAKTKADNEIRIQKDSADYERKQSDAERKKPKTRSVKFVRDNAKQLTGAEITEH